MYMYTLGAFREIFEFERRCLVVIILYTQLQINKFCS